MFQEGYMAYLHGWNNWCIAQRIVEIVDAEPENAEDLIEDFLDGHAAAAKENSNAI